MRHALHCLMDLVLLAAASVCHAQTPPENLDFERSQPGAGPPGWIVPTADYEVVITETNPAQGRWCAELASGEKQASPFGNLMRTIDAEPYRGKRVRLRAAVRIEPEGVTDRAQLWFRVDRPDRQMGFFDNMSNRPICDRTWHYYEITGDVAADAMKLNFGLMLLKRGKAWLDDVTLEVVADAAAQPADPPRKLDDRGLDNLVAFARLLGYVRYFHPSDAARDTDWPAFAVAGVRKVEGARDAADLVRVLTELLQPIAPAVRVYTGKEHPPLPSGLSRPSDAEHLRVAYWEHVGVGLEQRGVYASIRKIVELDDGKLPAGVADPAKPFEAHLGAGVTCLVPLALWADGEHTLPSTPPASTQPASAPTSYTGNDRATRLADVVLAWNVFQHFYPYFDVIETGWPTELRKALLRIRTNARFSTPCACSWRRCAMGMAAFITRRTRGMLSCRWRGTGSRIASSSRRCRKRAPTGHGWTFGRATTSQRLTANRPRPPWPRSKSVHRPRRRNSNVGVPLTRSAADHWTQPSS